MKYANSLKLVGNTPIVRLQKLSVEYGVDFYIKLELFNLTGSIKDRAALKMVEDAEKANKLNANSTIIESSSGNLGAALAAICSFKGYKFICVVDPKTSIAKMNTIKAYGGSVVCVSKRSKNGSYIENRIAKVKKLLSKIENSMNLDQYNNSSNTSAHLESTGPEIFTDMDGHVDAVVGCLSTSGTMMGIAKYFKKQKSKAVMIGVEPIGSVLFGGSYRSYYQQGPGISFVPSLYDSNLLDLRVKVSDKDAFNTARHIARNEGLLLGGSTGAAIFAAIEFAKKNKEKKIIVIISPDGGNRYLDSFYSPRWMKKHKFTEGE